MVAWERGRYYIGGKVWGFELPKRSVLRGLKPCAWGSWALGASWQVSMLHRHHTSAVHAL